MLCLCNCVNLTANIYLYINKIVRIKKNTHFGMKTTSVDKRTPRSTWAVCSAQSSWTETPWWCSADSWRTTSAVYSNRWTHPDWSVWPNLDTWRFDSLSDGRPVWRRWVIGDDDDAWHRRRVGWCCAQTRRRAGRTTIRGQGYWLRERRAICWCSDWRASEWCRMCS